MELLYILAGHIPDIAILALAAFVFGAGGGLLSYFANRYWFRRWSHHTSAEDQLLDTVQTSLLGFSAFVLALAITNVSSNLATAEGAVRQEALDIYRLRREFNALGAAGADGNRALASYVQHVAHDEWPRLSRAEPSLSLQAQRSLDEIWSAIRAIQRDLNNNQPQIRDALNAYLMRIEQARSERLAAATNSIPNIFWLMILLFIGAASFMGGRNAPKQFNIRLNVIHMSAFGLVIALIMILDNPYRGETSVEVEIILDALNRQGGS